MRLVSNPHPKSRMLALLALLTAMASANAQDGESLFREGNELARDGIFRTALLRYRQAESRGFQSPLLAYNRGVAHYRLQQYQRAEAALKKAAVGPLAPRAWYNLGLVETAQGNTRSARRWFKRAKDASSDRRFKQLVDRALTSLRTKPTAPRAGISVNARRDRLEPPGELTLTVATRIAQDDNVYRSANNAYIDIGDPSQPTVNPNKRSGTFVPVDVDAKYVLHNEAGDTDFVFNYRLDGNFYTDKALDNATEISQRFSLAADMLLGDRALKNRRLYAAFVVRDHIETNFDPDDGVDRTFNGIDVSDRFSYRSAGINARWQQRFARWILGLDLRLERRDYENPETTLPNFDHDYQFLAPWLRYRLSERISVTGRFEYYRRDYDERPARDANGVLLLNNPLTEYRYQAYELQARYRFSRRYSLEGEYRHAVRDDEFAGYSDYDYDQLKLTASFNPRGRYKGELRVLIRAQNYPNAFAFNVPAGGQRDLDILAISATNEFRVFRRWSLWLEVRYADFASSDPRNEYSRLRTMLGFKWDYAKP